MSKTLCQLSAEAYQRQLRSEEGKGLFRHVIALAHQAGAVDVELLQTVQLAELAHLAGARGRIGRVEYHALPTPLPPFFEMPHMAYNRGGVVDGARLSSYDPASRTVTIRVDQLDCLEFWLEVELPLAPMERWLDVAAAIAAEEEEDGDGIAIMWHQPLALPGARGRIVWLDHTAGTYPHTKCNYASGVDGARLVVYNTVTRMVTLRVDESSCPEFWLELPIRLDRLERWLGALEGAGEGDD